jgi:hypothetical protein
MAQEEETVAELRKIIDSRHYTGSSERWKELLEQIHALVHHIITVIYNTDLTTEVIIDPLNPLKKSTIGAYNGKIAEQLGGGFQDWPPFTILRIAEVLVEPRRYYSNAEKFLRALGNICCVSSTVDDYDRVTEADGEKAAVVANGVNGFGNDCISVVTDEAQVILLSKIDWLSEADKKEVQSEGYLNGTFAVANSVFDHYVDGEGILEEDLDDADYVEEEEEDHEGEDSEEDQVEDDDLIRKRKAQEQNHTESHIIEESPEKKLKKDEDAADRTIVNDPVPTENEPRNAITETEQEEEKEEEREQQQQQQQEKEEEEEGESLANATLEEDKMQVD